MFEPICELLMAKAEELGIPREVTRPALTRLPSAFLSVYKDLSDGSDIRHIRDIGKKLLYLTKVDNKQDFQLRLNEILVVVLTDQKNALEKEIKFWSSVDVSDDGSQPPSS